MNKKLTIISVAALVSVLCGATVAHLYSDLQNSLTLIHSAPTVNTATAQPLSDVQMPSCGYVSSNGAYVSAMGNVCNGLRSQLAQSTETIWYPSDTVPSDDSVLSTECTLSDDSDDSMTVQVLDVNGDVDPIQAPVDAQTVCTGAESIGWTVG